MTIQTQSQSWHKTMRGREALSFYLFILPWTVGFLFFILGPIVASLFLSFTSYDIINRPQFIGLENFHELFTDELFWRSLYNTLYIVLVAVPLGMIVSFAVALLLNQKVRFMAGYRTMYFMPSIVPAVASAALWLYLLQPQWGLINGMLEFVGIPGPGWLASEIWSKPAIIMLMVWASGGTMIIYLAGLQDIPDSLYEAAEIDGANGRQKFRHVTLPLMTPTIFFTLVLGIIGTFQVFDVIFVLTDGMGGPQNSTLVYLIYLYRNGFNFFRMGYASAMAWILFMIILAITIVQFRTASRWVYYEGVGEEH
ncbi:MAG: sugar ABC transporter permease [Caldilineaceae bacterium]|nr:sugar ABC transporter permease [Caldilineaceae bacterium]